MSTATRERPAPAGPAGPNGPRAAAPRTGGSRRSDVACQFALVTVTAAAALGLVRLFADGSFAGPVLLSVVAAHAVAWGCRRMGWGILLSGLLSGIGLVLAMAWLVEPHTTIFGFPRGATWTAIDADLREAWRRFGEVKAPAESLRGFVLAAVAGVWIAATASDFFAFRMRARFEAMAPGFTLFVFASILGADTLRLPTTAIYLGSVLAFVLLSEAARSSAGTWLGSRGPEGENALMRDGALLGLAALAAAVIIGPNLPGAGSEGWVDLADGSSNSSRARVTVSPLVDIRGRLVDQTNVELFTVRSDAPSYWRLTSLDRFDGDIWSSLGTYQRTRGDLPDGRSTLGAERALEQDYVIGPLGTIWLPAAFRPDRVSGAPGARFDRDSSSLLSESPLADGLRYSVRSATPQLTEAQLAGATSNVPAEVGRRYLELPPSLPPVVVTTARQVTARATTPYAKARALQDWFRTEFEYDLRGTGQGHDNAAIERFLEVKRGYCEQFAGTFGAMARALGLPARVAVGFTPGVLGADGQYQVRGRDAHAWPEVYLAGFGWVAFEPTPRRGAPGAEAYTGVSVPGPETTGDAPGPTTTVTTPGGTADSTIPEEGEQQAQPETAGQDDGGRQRWLWVVFLGVAAIAYIAGVPMARRRLVRRRRAAAGTPRDKVLVAWRETEDALALSGRRRRPAETSSEYAARVSGSVPSLRSGHAGRPLADDLARLATDVAAAGFSPTGVPDEVATRSIRAADEVVASLREQSPRWQRMLVELDPRRLVRPSRG